MRLSGKNALITGAARGIGLAFAKAYVAEGARVAIADIDIEAARAAAAGIGEGAIAVQMDVADPDSIDSAVASTIAAFGQIDILINNAAIFSAAPITEISRQDYSRVFDINVWGVLSSMKHEIPEMIKGGGGAIINTSSIAGHIGMPGAAVYIASKHAVEGLTKTAALEYAQQGIRVNAVAPGGIATDMIDRFAGPEGSEMRDGLAQMHPLGRLGTADEIAGAVLFLASDAAAFITGESLKVDGGFVAQ